MKGDFTRSTFRPEKHYTSVRMQQGRLQLDSDWNEQVDIQAHLYRTQTIDLIGAESGVPTSGGDTGKLNLNSFKVSVTPEFKHTHGSEQVKINDLMIEPGHLYVNGTLCELSGTAFDFQLVSQPSASETQGSVTSNRVTVSTLNVDGHKLEAGQWIEIDLQSDSEKLYQIIEIDAQKLELILSKPISEIKGQMRRRLTYQMQPDYPNPEKVNDGFYLVYLDVWQRHITAIDDPGIREVALINTPDTTTRTKTLWQLKLQKLDQSLITAVATSEKEKTQLLQQLGYRFKPKLDADFESLLNQAIVSNQAKDKNQVKDQLQQLFEQLFSQPNPAERKTLQQHLKQQFRKELTASSRQTFRDLVDTPLRRQFKSLLDKINSLDVNKKLLRKQFGQLLMGTDSTSATVLRQQFESLPDEAISTGSSKADLLTTLDQLLKATSDSRSQRIELRRQFRKWLNQANSSVQENTLVQEYEKLLDQVTTSDLDREELLKQLQTLLQQAADSAQRSTFRKRLRQLLQDPLLNEAVALLIEAEDLKTLNAVDPNTLIKTIWQKLLKKRKERTTYMNACAGLCPVSGSPASNSSGYRRLENQLYRVEIHDSGQVGDADINDQGQPKATFKWSRDNGSVVSAIEKIQDNVITIRRTSNDTWTNSKSGQWIELTTEEMELKGEPGILAPLIRASDTKIEFNRSRAVGSGGATIFRSLDSVSDKKFTKVRRWDQMTQTPTLLTRSEWIELDGGIKIKFDKASQLETGDYWLIPARSATNDIEWPNDQAEQGRQPLAQPRLGIQHDYCLLAVVEVKDGKFQAQIEDHRFIFPPLVRCLDTAGGTITGDLNVEGKLKVGLANPKGGPASSENILEVSGSTKISQAVSLATDGGSVTIGSQPSPSPDASSSPKLQVNGTTQIATSTGSVVLGLTPKNGSSPETVLLSAVLTGSDKDPEKSLEIGFQDSNSQNSQLQFTTTASGYTFDQDLTVEKSIITNTLSSAESNNLVLETKGNLVLKTDDQDRVTISPQGNVGIGTSASAAEKLTVNGSTKISQAVSLATDGGNVTIGTANPSDIATSPHKLQINGTTQVATSAGSVVLGLTPEIGSPSQTVLLSASLANSEKSLEIGFQDSNSQNSQLQFTTTASGYTFDQDLTVEKSIITNTLSSAESNNLVLETKGNLVLKTDDQERVTISPQGNIGVGTTASNDDRLTVQGTVNATTFKGSGSGLTGLVKSIGDTMTGTLTIQIGDLTVSSGNVGIGTSASNADRLTVQGTVNATTFKGSGSGLTGLVKSIGDTMTGTLTIQIGDLTVSSGNVGIGTSASNANRLTVQGTVNATKFQGDGSGLTKVVKTEGDNTLAGALTLQTGNLTVSNGNVGIGTPASNDARLNVDGTVQATRFQGDGSGLTKVVKTGGDTMTGSLTIQNGDLTLVNQLLRTMRSEKSLEIGSRDGIWAHFSTTYPRFHFDRSITLEAKELTATQNNDQLIALLIQPKFDDKGYNSVKHYGLVVKDGDVSVNGTISGDRLVTTEGVVRSPDKQDLMLKVGNDTGIIISQDKGKVRIGGIPSSGSGTAAKLYVDDDAYIKGQVFGKKVGGQEIVQISSGLLKEDIADLTTEEVANILSSLKPVKFAFKTDAAREPRAGFIAEETHDLLTSADKQGIKILDVVAILTKAMKDSQETVIQLSELVETQRSELATLQAKVETLTVQKEHNNVSEIRSLDLQPSWLPKPLVSQNLDLQPSWLPQPLMSQNLELSSSDIKQPHRRRRSFYSRLKLFFRRLLNGRRKTNRTL